MTSPATLAELETAQMLVRALVEDADEETCRSQQHPDLSPLGWHLAHCVYVECYWLREVVAGDARITRPLEKIYMPPHVPKPERGRLLPPRAVLVQWARDLQQENLHRLAARDGGHPLLRDEYLQGFLIQHYSQHYETMLMILTEREKQNVDASFTVDDPLQAAPPDTDAVAVPAGHYRIGGQRPLAYDNELPVQRARLGPYRISKRPVSNAGYLAFMEDGGYRNRTFWSEAGWRWRQAHAGRQSPEHWCRDAAGHWHGVGVRGAYPLTPDEPVLGLTRFEAEAVARWAGGQLPHEYQWEAACRLGLLEQSGRVWEWCANSFMPYEGFEAFPYREYSEPWFDGNHYVLRGGSLHTRPAIRRPSFRNFHEPHKGYIFAGVRPVFD